MHLDRHRLIMTKDPRTGRLDGGDTLQRQGMFWYLLKLGLNEKNYSGVMPARWFPRPWVRHPDQWSDPHDVSRDQLVPWILMGYETSWRAPNGDISVFTNLISRRDSSLRYIGECGLVVTCLNRIGVLPRWDHAKRRLTCLDLGDVGDDINFSLELLHALRYRPTFIAKAIRYIYMRFRPENYGNMVKTNNLDNKPLDDPEAYAVMGAWAWYHRKESGGNPEFVEMFRYWFRRYFV